VVMVTHDHSLVNDIADWEVRFAVSRESRHNTVATTRFSKAGSQVALG
jgi:hypothetical protein